MLNLYLYKRKEGVPDSYLLNIFTSEKKEEGLLFQKVSVEPFKKMVNFVDSPSQADYMFIPHSYFSVKDVVQDYFSEAEKFAKSQNLKTIIFAYGDHHNSIDFENSIILRPAKYRSTLVENEIILSPFVEDLGSMYGVEVIEKDEVPIVGFAGMTHLPTKVAECKYQLRLLKSFLSEVTGKSKAFERQGLHFRRKALKVLDGDDRVDLRTQKRKSYSAAQSTIQGDSKIIRQQFVDSIKSSHLPLVIRGDGNYSLRYFEVLSLGRVPLFIDTDTALPFEDEIDYDSFMLRVDYKDIKKLSEIVDKFWKETTNEQFISMQKKAREVFETKLKPNVFYKQLFEKLNQHSI